MTALKDEVGQREEMIRVLKTGQAPSAAKATRDILDPGRRPALPSKVVQHLFQAVAHAFEVNVTGA